LKVGCRKARKVKARLKGKDKGKDEDKNKDKKKTNPKTKTKTKQKLNSLVYMCKNKDGRFCPSLFLLICLLSYSAIRTLLFVLCYFSGIANASAPYNSTV
jgi:hypothetical protein